MFKGEFGEADARDEARRCGGTAKAFQLFREAQPSGDVVAWRDYVEQRLKTWRQRTMNKAGYHLALDDFMGQDSIDDLIDYVCSEYEGPPDTSPQPAERVAMTDEQIVAALKACGKEDHTKEGWIWRTRIKWARAIEAHHGITSNGATDQPDHPKP